jgi:hypothetical protein
LRLKIVDSAVDIANDAFPPPAKTNWAKFFVASSTLIFRGLQLVVDFIAISTSRLNIRA